MNILKKDIKHFMSLALEQAKLAAAMDEVPVGAVIAKVISSAMVNNTATDTFPTIAPAIAPTITLGNEAAHSAKLELVTAAHNQRERAHNPIYHAEIKAIEQASAALKKWRLSDCVLFVTLEPCLMCAGAIVSARLPLVVYAANDPKSGAVESLYNIASDKRLNHNFDYISGIMKEESSKLLKEFFAQRRGKNIDS